MSHTAEDLTRILSGTTDPFALGRQIPAFSEGWADLVARVQNLEHNYLTSLNRIVALEHALADAQNAVHAIASDRDDYRKRVEAVEKIPNDNAAKIAELEKRLRTVEGAVQSPNAKVLPPVTGPEQKPTVAQSLGLTEMPKAPA